MKNIALKLKKSNFLNYIQQSKPFDKLPFNAVDNIVFSQMTYLPFDGIVPGIEDHSSITLKEVAEVFLQRLKSEAKTFRRKFMFKSDPEFIEALGNSPRFGDCELFAFVNHVDTHAEKQFSAMGIHPVNEQAFVAYRGTDRHFVAWKEDFNMGFSDTVPAQQDAVSYLNAVAPRVKSPSFRVGGHSKGGNLAIYAAAFCRKEIKHRITEIYSNDAPGFRRSVIARTEFAEIKEKIRSFVPETSIIGMLLEQAVKRYTVVKSERIGIMQHDLYSWSVAGNGLVQLDNVSNNSRFIRHVINDFLENTDDAHRRHFTDALYQILTASKARTFQDLTEESLQSMKHIFLTLGNIDDKTRSVLTKSLMILLLAAKNNFGVLFRKG